MTEKKQTVIRLNDLIGSLAEDKDVARKLRQDKLWPHIKNGDEVVLDFEGVEDITQSFAHALLSELIRETQGEVLDLIYFKNCNETVKIIINMVTDYMTDD